MSVWQRPIAVVGASGLVGRELVRLLDGRRAPEVDLFAGHDREMELGGVRRRVRALERIDYRGYDLVFLCAPSAVAIEEAPRALAAGAFVIDNSSAFRLAPGVPLVVPEANGETLEGLRAPGLIANPNCSTILLLLAVAPLHRAFGCRRLEVTTYQAISGAGSAAMRELEAMSRAELAGDTVGAVALPEPVAFNVFSHDSAIDPATGYNGEELKLVNEVARILPRAPALTATCVRVPVWRSHCEAVTVELREPATEAEVRAELAAAEGVELMDDREQGRFPTARKAAGGGTVLVGRIRPDRSRPPANPRDPRWPAFHLFLAGDQLLKGAALNAVQIAELLPAATVT